MSVTIENMIATTASARTASRTGTIQSDDVRYAGMTRGAGEFPGEDFEAFERLYQALELRPGERLLNLAAGDAFTPVKAGALPYRDAEFHAVASGFDVAFAGDHRRTAAELLRVCRRGGRIGLACWTPESFVGRLLATIETYRSMPASASSPALWGTKEYLDALFGNSADALGAETRTCMLHDASPELWLKSRRRNGRFMQRAYAAVDPDWHNQLSSDLLAIIHSFNEADDGTMLIHSDYLEFLVHKSSWRH